MYFWKGTKGLSLTVLLCARRFYFPQGKPILAQHLDLVLKKVAAAFDTFPNQQVPRHQFGAIAKVSSSLFIGET